MDNEFDNKYIEEGLEYYKNNEYEKAFELFKKASDLGNAQAMKNLADCYYEGKGIDRDYVKAFEYYQKASEAGDEKAVNNLIYCYHYGIGVDKNVIKASELSQKKDNKEIITKEDVASEQQFIKLPKVDKLFSLKGRVTRKVWWMFELVILMFSIFICLINKYAVSTVTLTINFIIILPLLVFTISYLTIGVRRLHDLNLSGVWIFFNLILLGIFITLVIIIKILNFYLYLPHEVYYYIGIIKTIFIKIETFYPIVLGFVSGFIKGTNGDNKYGPKQIF